MMRRLILAGAALVFAAAGTASAMASDQGGGKSGRHVGGFHTAASARIHHSMHSSRFAGVRGAESPYPGGFIDLGPLGFMAACGAYPGGHGYCGPSSDAPIDAWSY